MAVSLQHKNKLKKTSSKDAHEGNVEQGFTCKFEQGFTWRAIYGIIISSQELCV